MNSLFSGIDWRNASDSQLKSLCDEIARFDGNRLLNTSVDDLCDYFVNKYRIEVPVLREDHIVADQNEQQIDVSQDPMRDIRNRSRPFYVPGIRVEITVPFDGDARLFKVQPTLLSLNPPVAEIRKCTLILEIQGAGLQADQARNSINRELLEIKRYLDALRVNADELNNQLPQFARNAIEGRREKLLENQNLVASLGFPLKERGDTPKTFVDPEVRRKITPILPDASTKPYKPEPTLSMDDYNHILNVIQNMARVMELSPAAFVDLKEEFLRSHFLVQLNGHYEGGATGETFNYEGKTDILIRKDGKNIFIAECKFWGGQKKFSETIDQLLSYSSWRDTKVAIIIFNKNKNFSAVLDAIEPTAAAHSNYKKSIGRQSETSFRYTFAHKNDANREMTLTVLAFDVPSQA